MKLIIKTILFVLSVFIFCSFISCMFPLLEAPSAIVKMTSTKGEVFKTIEQIPNGKSLIYFYREPSLVGAISAVGISVNNNNIVDLKNNGYFPYLSDTGKVNIIGKFGIYTLNLDLTTKSDSIYYVRTGGKMGITNDYLIMGVINNKEAESQIKDNNLQKNK